MGKSRAGKLSDEQVARAKAKAKANNSTLKQELFLASGGTLRQWYGQEYEAANLEPPRPTDGAVLKLKLRILTCVREKLGRSLTDGETAAIDACAELVATAPSDGERARLEDYAVATALRLAGR